MQVKGRLVQPLPPEASNENVREFWRVQPWIVVTILMGLLIALVIPGLLLDLNRGF